MYIVIFEAEASRLDDEYYKTAARMRELARDCGCVYFNSVSEEGKEISVSMWNSKEQIDQWKNNPEHAIARDAGKRKWYKSFNVRVAEVMREYNS